MSQVSFLWIVILLQLSQDVCSSSLRPAWATLLWDITQKEQEELCDQMAAEEPFCLHDSVCKLYHTFYGLSISQKCLDTLYCICMFSVFMAACLALYHLPSKRKKIVTKTETTSEILIDSMTEMHETHELREGRTTHTTDKLLCRLVVNTSKMKKYMKHMAHNQIKKNRKSNKKRKADEVDEDNEHYFPVCSHNRSSSGDVTMYEI